MNKHCIKCHLSSPEHARFCAHCGMSLSDEIRRSPPARVPHPSPRPAPTGSMPCHESADVHYTWESAWGGATLLSTEGLAITLFNRGYALADVSVQIVGKDEEGNATFSVTSAIRELPTAAPVVVEIPSYELTDGHIATVEVTIVSAEFSSTH